MHQNEKINSAVALLTAHNQEVGDGPGKVDLEKFPKVLTSYGVSSSEDLKSLSWESLIDIIDACSVEPKFLIKPKLLAQKVSGIFRSGSTESSQEGDKNSFVSEKKASKMSLKQLVENYDPEQDDSPIATRLKTLSHNEPFIVFVDDINTIDVANTLKLLTEVKKGMEGLKSINVGDTVKQTFRVGECPNSFVSENPFFKNRPLRMGEQEICDQTNRSLSGIDLDVRQFIRLAVEKGFIQTNINSIHDTLDRALEENSLVKFKKRYPEVSILFDELFKQGTLPRLKIKQSAAQGGGNTNPFQQGKKINLK